MVPTTDTSEVQIKGSDDRPVVLVALEPRTYSETIGGVMKALRPNLVVEIIEPEARGAALMLLDPELVLCSQPNTFASERDGPCWVEFYPYDEREPIRVNGACEEMEGLELEDVLSLIDRLVTPIG